MKNNDVIMPYFAQVMTVQNYGVIGSLESKSQPMEFSQDFSHELLNCLWNRSLVIGSFWPAGGTVKWENTIAGFPWGLVWVIIYSLA